MNEILQKEHAALRGIAKSVSPEEITTPKIRRLVDKMKKILAREEDGVALAAPQIGEPFRIFVVSGKVFSLMKNEQDEKMPDMVFINPEFTKLSKEKETLEEGCLSVRHYYGKVKRHKKASVRAYNEKGKLFLRGGSSLLAQIFQHEMDHLNGILFTDKATGVKEILPEEA
ncbi:MAG: peptide deformylase [bacterium]|nr:peptide deformylase [bacterium]